MMVYLKSEFLKVKKSDEVLIIGVLPLLTFVLVKFLYGKYFAMGAFNWWYMMLLPFTVAFISMRMIRNEKRYLYHGMFGTTANRTYIWYGKIIVGILVFGLSTLLLTAEVIGASFMAGKKISWISFFCAAIILVVTVAWQVPLFLYMFQRFPVFVSLMGAVILNFGCSAMASPARFWWIPFAIPARMMCSIIRVHPNGLMITKDTRLLNPGVIWIGVLISVFLLVSISFLTAKEFEGEEV